MRPGPARVTSPAFSPLRDQRSRGSAPGRRPPPARRWRATSRRTTARGRGRAPRLVDAQHHGTALEALAPEHVAVEHLALVPERLPVAVLVVEVGALHLDRVPVPGREQGDVLGLPARVEQCVHRVVGCVERIGRAARHEPNSRAVAATGVHAGGGERTERLVDLARVPEVVVQHQRDELHRRPAEAGEDALVLVGVDVEPALLLVAQRLEHRTPPAVREVLRLVDDHRVVLVLVVEVLGEVAHQLREVDLPEVTVAAVAFRCAPLQPELVEGADEGRAVLAAPGRHLSLEVLREPDRVAEQRDPLRLPVTAPTGELLRLLQGEHGLPAAGATAHLDTVEQPGHLQEGRLLLGEPVGLGGALLGVRVHVVLRGQPAGEDVDDELRPRRASAPACPARPA